MGTLVRNVVPGIAIAVLVGAALYASVGNTTDNTLKPFADSRAVVEGVVVRDPEIRENSIRFVVHPERVNGVAVLGSKNVIVSTDRFANAVVYGDRVRITGTLTTPKAFETDSGRTFNYPKYLWARGVSYELPFADVSVRAHDEGNPITAALLSTKHLLIHGIERALPEPYAALAEGLLLGEKQSLGSHLYDAFRNAGVVHIIVLSGYNVSLVIESVLFISLRTLPRLVGCAVAAAFMLAFTVLTGASETTVRAAIMALLMMVARILHRPSSALRGLLVAAAAMALLNPFLVLYDLSFQLSVLATLGLILFSDTVAKRLSFVPRRFGLREIIATTLATQTTVLPLLVLSVGAVSLVFLPANALILPTVPLAMFLSFIASLASYVSSTLGMLFGFPAYMVLAYDIHVAEFFGTLPFASLTIPPSYTWIVFGALSTLYIATFSFFLVRRSRAIQRGVFPPHSNLHS